MKKVFIVVAFIATFAGVIFTACKKEEEGATANSVAQTEQSMSPTEQKVLDFLADYDAMKRGAKAEGDALTPEETRWHWETTLNYCHGFTQSYLTEMRQDTILVDMPQTDANGNIAYADQLATYGSIVAAVRETYQSIEMEDKTLQFVTISLDNQLAKDNGRNAVVVINTGSDNRIPDPGPWYGVPFSYGECYVWGSFGEYNVNSAAVQITNAIARYDLSHALEYVPCPNCYTFIENPYIWKHFIGSNETDSVFYLSGPTYEIYDYEICWQDLNKYYTFILLQGHYEGMPTNLYGCDWYFKTEVIDGWRGGFGSDYSAIYHYANIWRATRHWRIHESTYPVNIDAEQ